MAASGALSTRLRTTARQRRVASPSPRSLLPETRQIPPAGGASLRSFAVMNDPLTKLPTRGTFCREVEARTPAVHAAGQRVAVLLMGVNDFKDVNSAFGHDTGDRILGHVAARMARFIGLGWGVGRADGDVFAVLAPLTTAGPEDLVATLATVLADPFALSSGVRVQLSGSIGVAVSGAAVGSASVLLGNAEIAMYRAKSERQAWALHDAALDEQATDRLLNVAELRGAIAAGQLEVHYQPVVDMTTGQATSVEALVRWRHPERGLILPGEFIALAEKYGLVGELTEFVVSTVAEQTRDWAAAGRSLPCAVNLSLHCLVDPASSQRLVAALTALHGAVTVEVTESVFADRRAVTVLEGIAAAGVPCAIDDFGTGYSCLASLNDLPVTTIKIDRSFIKDVAVDDRAFAVVEAILALANALGLDVIAEGMENAATAIRLRDAGVVHGQGFWFSRPMPAAELDVWLASRPHRIGSDPSFSDGLENEGDSQSDHVVFVYDNDEELLRELTTYVSEGLSGLGRSLVVATAEHRAALRAALPPRRLERAEREGRFLEFDVDEMLALIMRGGTPDPDLFEQHVGSVVRNHRSETGVLSAYCEMVSVLWKDANILGALQLEELWNELQRSTSFWLAQPGDGLANISQRHTLIHMSQHPDLGTDTDLETLRVLLDSTRTLLRVDSAEQAVGVLMRAVSSLGGTTVPAFQAPAGALPIDVSLGEADPQFLMAPPGSQARRNLERLLPGLVEDARLASTKAGRLARLSDQVDTDPLTGLGNRRGLSRVRALLATDSVAIVDLDHFSRTNDTYGHEAGDRVLVAFSRALRKHLRKSDLVFRLGGEEFLVIMPGTTPERVLVALEHVRQRWQVERPLPVTFSAGVAGVDEGDLSAAVLASDTALYVAKAGGRDRFELADLSVPDVLPR